ncbi:MAG: Do family serine endopeptidase [Verrucomicrobia bacterium]|nr:Do family serine endopeptidase [Verrucomicrobiota bacterium]MBV8641236.1 Do family serine endopeptidase [Verrucomicrobiota bacterium]
MKSFLKFLVFVLLLALAISLIYVWQAKQPGQPQVKVEKFTPADKSSLDLDAIDVLQRLDDEYAKVVNAVIPSVVSITTTKTVSRRTPIDPLELFFGRRFSDDNPAQQKVTSLGSGVIVSKEGHIVTNNHVLNGTDDVTVQLSDGRESKAKIVGTDGQIDIAVLKIDLPNLTPLAIGDSDKVRVGQIVMAIGNPFGLDESVSQGIISAKDRSVVNDSQVEFFQTDTAINPGNSGGPLVNIRGEVIGINTIIYSESGGNQGIGFAIPSNMVRAAVNSIISKGRVIRGYLGVAIQPVTKDIAEQFKLDSAHGALVTDVTPGSPAEKAGIIRGDVIRKVNGYDIKDTMSLVNRIAEADVGSNLMIDLVRDGTAKAVTAQITEQPPDVVARMNRKQGVPAPSGTSENALFAGIEVQNLTQQLRTEAKVPSNVNGVIVTSVDPTSPVAQQVRPGDVIEQINRQPVANVDEFERVVGQLDSDRPVMVGLARNRQRSFVIIQPN